MQRTGFILGVALLVTATTLAITITIRRPQQSEGTSASQHHERSARTRPSSPFPAASPALGSGAKGTRREAAPERFTVSAPPNHPQHDLLVEKARKVESEARSHLDHLTERLELTGEQRLRLFPILARTSREYDPALQVSGLPGGAPALPGQAGDRELNQVLDPPQRDQLIEDSLNDLALWEEIIGKLQRRLDDQTPQVPAGEGLEQEPVTPAPASRRRGNLFDTVEPE